jgi:uncharacterized protein (TIGR02646 family)
VIKLQRPVKIPSPLLTAAANQTRVEAEEWAQGQVRAVSKSKLVQQLAFIPDRRIVQAQEVRHTLLAAQHQKCAFCESPLGVADTSDVEWFRPSSSAVDSSGLSSLPHYAWLTVEWNNLHISCPMCSQSKGRRFPVDGPRCPISTQWGDVATSERALLLDPFVDDPDSHLLFTDDGLVSTDTSEGRATIDCFSLNRSELVEARREAAAQATMEWQAGEVENAVAPEHPFAGARRHTVRRLAERQPEKLSSVVDVGEHLLVGGVRMRKISDAQQVAADSAETQVAMAQSAYSLDDPTANHTYFATAKYIYAIEARNWKAIRHIRVEVPSSSMERAPWLSLLGENGAGKSSLLQGVALALLGQRSRDRLNLRPDAFIHNGARSTEVKVWLTGITEPCVLTARRGDTRFSGSTDPKVLVLAYGATRLLPGASHGPTAASPSTTDDIADVDNLFDPFVPMADANGWMLSLNDKQVAAAARALRVLLRLEGTDALLRYRGSGEIRCRTLGAVVPLARMSDGYQSVVATACDVMAVLLSRWGDMAAAEGIVLLDELGAHLHPRWRMRIVESLRAVFPRVQFLVTTHDPLCLRGLAEGEVALVERRKDAAATVVVRQDLPPIAGLRADQLLTSELFGLRSTVDPQLEAAFDEYYRLLALRRRTRAQVRRIDELKDQLDRLRMMGDTTRERLVFEAADRWLATRQEREEPNSLRQENDVAVAILAEVWASESPDRFPQRDR